MGAVLWILLPAKTFGICFESKPKPSLEFV
jgi:hypothetical protein